MDVRQPFPTAEPGTPPQGLLVYRTTDWAADVGHLSHANAAAGVAASQQYVCGGNARREQLPRNNEIVCFMLDGSLRVLVVAPVMTDVDAQGGIDEYHRQPKGNLDITGRYFIWTSNVGGSRRRMRRRTPPTRCWSEAERSRASQRVGRTTAPR